ncbi:hypothetical protein ZIOFF_066738 [Zingiber officinale]|uniref:DDT domain-containing protein n=2 Tax=Zingiber officinale TaxID=94328 RepID=A0A8J5EYY2_ZINOF|nr:hypothetical protein ZIOFF_066738 [Zingiber officinale]
MNIPPSPPKLGRRHLKLELDAFASQREQISPSHFKYPLESRSGPFFHLPSTVSDSMAVPQSSPADESLAAGEHNRPAEASAASPDRVDNPEKGKTCHQCRQKRTEFSAPCRQIRRGKPCPIKYCHKCLVNRYGEKPEDVSSLDSWICPKCRGDCNCSCCMKKKGQRPTGILIHKAKAIGFASVHELLFKQGPDGLNAPNGSSSSKTGPPEKSLMTHKRSHEEENCLIELRDPESFSSDDKNIESSAQKEKKRTSKKKRHKESVSMDNSDGKAEIMIPQGQLLTEVAGSEWAVEDVGAALQFLEFCNAFSEVLDINKGEPESVLHELARGSVGRRGQYSSTAKFHVKLLSFIQNCKGDRSVSNSTMNEDEWLQLVIECLNESDCDWKTTLEALDEVSLEYDSWIPSDKLRLLNLLCDRTLETKELRDWIDVENQKYIERKKEAKGTIVSAKKKEKDLTKKLKDEMAKATLSLDAPFSIEDHENLMSQIRAEREKAHAEKQEIMEQLPKNLDSICRHAVRTDSIYLEGEGHVYWKLGSYYGGFKILHQVLRSWDSVILEDKWYAYGEDEGKSIERDISSLRKKKVKRSLRQKSMQSNRAGDNSSNDPPSSCSVMEGYEGASGTGNSGTK